MNSPEWRPSADMAALELRAAMLREVREYFAREGVMEVETPVLARATVTDVHLASLRTRVAGHGDYYLQTSPEYAMKRLLAAGAGDIYQVSRVFRDGERGSLHNPEFTLVEWYRVGFDVEALMTDVARLMTQLLSPYCPLRPPERLTYRHAVRTVADVDPISGHIDELLECLRKHAVPLPSQLAQERDGCLDLLMSTVVGPRLGAGGLTFVYDYPAGQAALARVRADDPSVAERFEVYLDGIELANGFHELADASEQRLRFEQDLASRREHRLETPPLDERLLAALSAGLPDCSGVAMGFDRLVMRAAGVREIDRVIAFPADRA